MTPEGKGDDTGAVPEELLRAGVYVPGAALSLEEEAVRALSDGGEEEALWSALCAEPRLLDQAVRRLAPEVRRRSPDALLPAGGRDLLLAAPLARECGLPLRRRAGALPAAGGSGEIAFTESERVLVVAVVSGREAADALQEVRSAGAVAVGSVSVGRRNEEPTGESWCLVTGAGSRGDGAVGRREDPGGPGRE